jgi:beta-galactosidase/beta-glucuronidase
VVDEANIETHGFDPAFAHDAAHPAHATPWLAAFMARVTRMYERDKCMPCIILWSLGNEAGYGPAHDAAAAWLRRRDASRPVHYEVRRVWCVSVWCVFVWRRCVGRVSVCVCGRGVIMCRVP